MILRRLKAHIEKENWFAVSIDFCIVVIGVFVGLQVANWNESRAEDRRERAYLERLDAEFDIVDNRVTRAIQTYDNSHQATTELLSIWEVGPTILSGEDTNTPGFLFVEMLMNVVPAKPPAAFRELVSSGELSIISNEDLRAALYEFDSISDVSATAYQSAQRDMGNLRRLVFKAFLYDPDRIEEAFLGQNDTERDQNSVVGRFVPDAFFDEPDFQGELNGAIIQILNLRVMAEAQNEVLQRIKMLIEEELGP